MAGKGVVGPLRVPRDDDLSGHNPSLPVSPPVGGVAAVVIWVGALKIVSGAWNQGPLPSMDIGREIRA